MEGELLARSSEENRRYLQRADGHVLLGEKLRQGEANHQALARPGRYATVAENLEVQEGWVGEGLRRRRLVVGRNLPQAERDRIRREKALHRLQAELAAVGRRRGDARLRAEGELLAHPTLSRSLTRRGGRLVLGRAKVRAEESLDGKFLLSCTDDTIPASELALLYQSLLKVERSWRDLKHVFEIRPVYHRKEERIRSPITLCFLALVLVRVAENATGETWLNLRRELDRMHLGEFAGPAGRVLQRTETTPRQREILRDLGIKEPPLVLAAQPGAGSRPTARTA